MQRFMTSTIPGTLPWLNSMLPYLYPDFKEDYALHRLFDFTSRARLHMAPDSTSLSYWMNWRFLLCAIWVLGGMVVSALLIWRYEGGRKESKNRLDGSKSEGAGCLYQDQVWETCLESVHPIWLLAYRLVAFAMLMALLLADAIVRGGGIYYFYTQWTFTLVAVYFGLGSVLSLHGYLCHRHEESARNNYVGTDSKRGSYIAPKIGENEDIPNTSGNSYTSDDDKCRTDASIWGYALQIIFQICAGAVALTDSVFWMLLFPILTAKAYHLSFLVVCLHSVNAVLLLGDILLSRLHFPFFRIAYFVLWTSIFVIYQWIIHACVSISWPYPFMDLSSPTAPVWYLGVGLMLFPCFGIFSLIFRLKRCYASR